MELIELITSLRNHGEKYPAEKEATLRTIEWVEKHEDFAFVKDNLDGHLTASLLIINTEKTRVLLMFHKKLQFWVQFGGHCDGEIDVKNVAIREFHEESGIDIEPIILDAIFNVDVHPIPIDKKGTPPHFHYDILFLGAIPEDTSFSCQESEVDDIRWFDIEGIEKYIAEPRMLSMIEKIKNLK